MENDSMIIPDLPLDEELRLLDFHSYDFMDANLELEFDELVELAATVCQCPVSVISLLDKDKQWFKAKRGTLISETPRNHAICGHTILQDNVLVVEDTKTDARFSDNPLVCGEMNIRFYAGVPIISPKGYKLGSVCVIDHTPRKLSAVNRKSLTIIAAYITRLLELKEKNKTIYNRTGELLKLNNLAIENVIKDNESVKENIATELHENMAQMLAASRIYLQMAIQNEKSRNFYIQQVIDDLGDLLNRMRHVSYALSPQGVRSLSLKQIVEDMVRNAHKNYPFNVRLTFSDRESILNSESNLACIRIIEEWMGILKTSGDVTNAHITISTDKNISLLIKDDGCGKMLQNVKEHLCTSGIYARVQRSKGTLMYRAGKGINELQVQIANLN